MKEELLKILEMLDENEILYLYEFVRKLFGDA